MNIAVRSSRIVFVGCFLVVVECAVFSLRPWLIGFDLFVLSL